MIEKKQHDFKDVLFVKCKPLIYVQQAFKWPVIFTFNPNLLYNIISIRSYYTTIMLYN